MVEQAVEHGTDRGRVAPQFAPVFYRTVRSEHGAGAFVAALLIPAELSRRLRLLSNLEIGQLLEDEVWSNLNLLAPESTICLVAADRLRRLNRPTKGELTR
jgi:hypothetical protein